MQSSKLIQVLKTFSVAEMRRFAEFANSPFFNKNQNIRLFVDYLKNHYPKFAYPNVEKEKVFTALFPKEKLNEQRIRDLISMTLKLAEEFLIILNHESKKILKQNYLLSELNQRGLDNLFEMRFKETKQLLAKTGFYENYYYENYFFNLTEFEYKNRVFLGDDKALEKYYDGTVRIKSLTSFYLFEVLIIYTFWVSAGSKFNRTSNFDKVEQALLTLKEKLVGSEMIIELYLLTLKMLITKDEKYFFELKTILCHKKFSAIIPQEQKGFLINLSNYCSDKISGGNYEYSKHAIEIYKTLLERNIFLQDGVISHVFFTNVVVHSIYSNQTEWLDGFMSKHRKFLQPHMEESTINYCLAQLNFHRKKYREVLKHLHKAHTNSIFRQMNIKALQLRTYYEMKDGDALLHVMDAYRHAISNAETIPKEIENAQLAFLKNMKKLIALKNNFEKAEAEKFKKELNANQKFIYLPWLLEKAKALNN